MALISRKKSYKGMTGIDNRGRCICSLEGIAQGLISNDELENLRLETPNIIDSAIKWIRKNLRYYRFYGFKALKVRQDIIKVVKAKNMASKEQKREVLDEFCKLFVNNVWIYENQLVKAQGSYITAKSIGCYFVTLNNYEYEARFPFAALEQFVKKDTITSLIKVFMEQCSKDFQLHNRALMADYNIEADYYENPVKKITLKNFLSFGVCLLFFLSVFCKGFKLAYKNVLTLNWGNFTDISKKTSNFLQTLGFLLEESYGINHNSTLGIIVFALSVFCGFLCLCSLKKLYRFICEFLSGYLTYKQSTRAAKVTEYFNGLNTKYKNIEQMIETLDSESILETKIECEKNRKVAMYLSNSRKNIPGFLKNKKKQRGAVLVFVAIICAAIIIGCNEAYKLPVQQRYNHFVSKLFSDVDTATLSAEKIYMTTSGMDVFAKADKESLVLYKLNAAATYSVVEEANPVEGLTKIQFKTQYGTIKGWIDSQMIEAFDPQMQPDLIEVMAVSYDASVGKEDKWHLLESTGAAKVGDGKNSSYWKATERGNGIYEWLKLNITTPGQQPFTRKIKTIGIFTGRGTSENAFQENARPIGFDIEFLKSGVVNEKVSVKINDAFGMQYVALNKPVDADAVKFVINAVAEGSGNTDSCINEIKLYE